MGYQFLHNMSAHQVLIAFVAMLSNVFCNSPNFKCSRRMGSWANTFPRGILLNCLQTSSMLPHFNYMLTRLFFTKRSGSQVVWMSCSWIPLTSLTGYKLGHTLSTWTKLNLWVLPFLLQLFENAPLGWCGIFVFWQWAKNLKFFQCKKEVLCHTRSS